MSTKEDIDEIYRQYAEDTKKIRADYMRGVRNVHIGMVVALVIVFVAWAILSQ